MSETRLQKSGTVSTEDRAIEANSMDVMQPTDLCVACGKPYREPYSEVGDDPETCPVPLEKRYGIRICLCFNCKGGKCFVRGDSVSNQVSEKKQLRTLAEIFADDYKQLPKTFGECLKEEDKRSLEQQQDFNLTRLETYFGSEEEQRCAVALYLKLEHRINADVLIEGIDRCEKTGEAPIQVYLRFQAFFKAEERDIIIGEWRRKHGYSIGRGR